MEEKTKFIIIVPVVALIISLFFNLQILSSKKRIESERNQLRNENTSLVKSIEENNKQKQALEERVNALNADLERFSQRKEEFEKQNQEAKGQIEALTKERDGLKEKLERRVAEEERNQALKEEVYWAGILRAKTDAEAQLENIRSQLKEAKLTNEQLQREKAAIELDLKSVSRDTQDAEQQLQALDTMSLELVREKNSRMQMQESLKAVKNENAILRRQLKTLTNRKVALESKVNQLEEEKNKLERRFGEMGTLLENSLSEAGQLKNKLDNIRSDYEQDTAPQAKNESIELPPIIVAPSSETTKLQKEEIPQGAPELAKVIEINRENNFVIIDAGEDAGLNMDDIFQVYRKDRVIATVEVVQLRGSIAACDIKKENASIRIGDALR